MNKNINELIFPKPQPDFLELVIDYSVAPEKSDDLAAPWQEVERQLMELVIEPSSGSESETSPKSDPSPAR